MATAALLAIFSPAAAHPHVWVTASVDLVFDDAGRITAINHSWTFDQGYVQMALEGLDTNGDGVYSQDELAPLTKDNITSIKDYDFFTVPRFKGEKQGFGEVTEYGQIYSNGTLELHFQLPLKQPIDPRAGEFMLKVYDPEFYVDFQLAAEQPVSVIGTMPQGCKLEVKPLPTTAELDQTRTMLASKPRDWKPETAEDFGAMFAQPVLVTCGA